MQKGYKEGEIEHKEIASVATEPSKLPEGFEWSTIQLDDGQQLEEVYELLKGNYVEDSESTFRFEYPKEFLLWALKGPGHNPDWHVGIRSSKDKKLLAFIAGTPVKAKLDTQTKKLA